MGVYDKEDIDLPMPPSLWWFGLTYREYKLYLKWVYKDEVQEPEEQEVTQVAPQPQGTGIIEKIRSWLFDPPPAPTPTETPLVLTETIIAKSKQFEQAYKEYKADREDFLGRLGEINHRDRLGLARQRFHEDFWLSLDWREFETEVGLLYSDLGYDVSLTYPYGDGGIDLLLTIDDIITVVQCKAHSKPIDRKDVDDLDEVRRMERLPVYQRSKARRLGRSLRDYNEAILVSSSGFTEEAIWLSGVTRRMRLVSLADLVHLSRKAAMNVESGRAPGRFSIDPSPRCLVCDGFMITHEDRWRCSKIRCRGWRAKRDRDS